MSKKQASFLNNWAEVGDPNSGIVRQSNTGREGERRIVALDPLFDPKNEQFIYNYRRQTKVPFVNAYGSELLSLEKPPKSASKQKAVKDPYNHLAVITERIPFRLVDAPQLTYPQSLYVLDRSLEGFEAAYDKCGPMRVNDRLIGFNNQGQCKVWVNEDFANNHPSYPRRRLMTTRPDSNQYLAGSKTSAYRTSVDEADMVQDIVDTVENYSEEGRFPEPFATKIHQRDLSFAEARSLLHQTISESRVPVPNRIDLISNRVRGYRKVTQQIQIQQQVVTPVIQTQTITQKPAQVQGYRFNYLPVEKPFQPNIFASRVGENIVYNGRVY